MLIIVVDELRDYENKGYLCSKTNISTLNRKRRRPARWAVVPVADVYPAAAVVQIVRYCSLLGSPGKLLMQPSCRHRRHDVMLHIIAYYFIVFYCACFESTGTVCCDNDAPVIAWSSLTTTGKGSS